MLAYYNPPLKPNPTLDSVLAYNHIPLKPNPALDSMLAYYNPQLKPNPTLDSVLAYCPDRRREVWRYLSYILVHSSWWHLAFNLGVQTLLGR